MRVPTLVRNCLGKSTAHGLSHAASAKSPFQSALWLIFFFLASIAFIYYLRENLVKYYSQPTSVTVKLRGSEFIPPDIHLCNMYPLAKSRLLTPLNTTERDLLMEDLNRLQTIMEKYGLNESASEYLWSSMSPERLFSVAGHLAHQTVLSSFMDTGEKISFRRYESTPNNEYFSCFRLSLSNETDFKGTAHFMRLYLYTDSHHETSSPVMFNNYPLSSYDYIYKAVSNVEPPSGIMIIFTAPGEYPHAESHSLLLSPGQYKIIKLKMHRSVGANTLHDPCHLRKHPIEYYNSLLGAHETLRYTKSFSDCKYRKILKKLMKVHPQCQCIPYMIPVTPREISMHPMCSNLFLVNDSETAALAKEQLKCLRQYHAYDQTFELEQCMLEKPCETISYSSDVSSADWPLITDVDEMLEKLMIDDKEFRLRNSPGLQEYLNNAWGNKKHSIHMTRYNFAVAAIKPGETRSVDTLEFHTYGLENLISDIGGLAGLYLGMSFLTILEFIDLFCDCLRSKMLLKEKRNRAALKGEAEKNPLNDGNEEIKIDRDCQNRDCEMHFLNYEDDSGDTCNERDLKKTCSDVGCDI